METTMPAVGDLVRWDNSPGLAYRVTGYDTAPDEDTHWSGFEVETGFVLVCAVGDDRTEVADPDELTPIDRDDFCGQCGQLGCMHDGRDTE